MLNPYHANDAYMRRENLAFFGKKRMFLPCSGLDPQSISWKTTVLTTRLPSLIAAINILYEIQ